MELIATETGLKSVQWEPFKNMAAWRRNAFRWDQRAGLFEKCWKIRLRGSVKGRQEESVNNMAICVVSEQFTSNRRRKMIHILHLSVQRKQQKHSDFDLRKLVYVENHVTIGFGELWKSSLSNEKRVHWSDLATYCIYWFKFFSLVSRFVIFKTGKVDLLICKNFKFNLNFTDSTLCYSNVTPDGSKAEMLHFYYVIKINRVIV